MLKLHREYLFLFVHSMFVVGIHMQKCIFLPIEMQRLPVLMKKLNESVIISYCCPIDIENKFK